MLNKKILYLLIIGLILQTVFLIPVQKSNAETTIPYMSPQQVEVDTNWEVCLAAPNTGFSAGMVVEFEIPNPVLYDWFADLTISDTATASEFSIIYGSDLATPCTGGTDRISETAPDDQLDRDLAVINGNKITITISDNIPANPAQALAFKFTDKTDANTNALKTPGTEGNYQMSFKGKSTVTTPTWNLFLYSDLFYVGNLNQTDITASVDPSITLTLGDFEPGYTNACPLGTFYTDQIAACSYSATVTTNAVTGYTAYIRQDHALWNLADNTKIIAPVADLNVTPEPAPTVEEYGLTISSTDNQVVFPSYSPDDCLSDVRGSLTGYGAKPITANDQGIASYFAQADGSTHGKTYLCHMAIRTGSTVAGNYSHTITITAVGNF